MSRGARTRDRGLTVVAGAGLAGLAAAVDLSRAGARVLVLEAAAQAGGRCRSYHDPQIDLVIDNGNHLVMSGNQAVARFLRATGASDRLTGPKAAVFPFHDLASGDTWTVRPNASALPWWIFRRDRRPPGARTADFLGLAGLMSGGPDETVAVRLRPKGPVWSRLMEPFLLAALNTPPLEGSAQLAGAVVRGTLARGGAAYRPRIAHPSLAAAFIEPALTVIDRAGNAVRTGARVRALTLGAGRVDAVVLGGETIVLGADDRVVLAVPPWAAAELLPGLDVPDAHHAILNGHFRHPPPTNAAPIMGVLGGLSEWMFAFEDRISVTVSAADAHMASDRQALAETMWREVCAVYGLRAPLPPWQIVKEKRATFAATPAQNARRPAQTTPYANLVLAGDWVRTGLPATIEGALRSGFQAAALSRRGAGVV